MGKQSRLQAVRKRTITDLVAEQLIGFIRNELKDGEKLPPERKLMEQLGVGRSSLREALRSLEFMGLIETRTGEGTFAVHNRSMIFQKPIEWGLFESDKSNEDILEARIVFETALIELTAVRITEAELEELEQLVEKMEQIRPPNIDEFLTLDFTFHDIIARASKNEVLHDTVMLTRRIIEQERADSIKTNYEYKKSAAYHKAILAALKTRSPDRARQAMSDHMAWTRRILRYDTKGGKR